MFSARWIRGERRRCLTLGLIRRGVEPHAEPKCIELDARNGARSRPSSRSARRKRNRKSKEIGAARAQGEDVSDLLAEVAGLKDAAQALEREEKSLAAKLDALLAGLPNLPAMTTCPTAPTRAPIVEIRYWGEPAHFRTAT